MIPAGSDTWISYVYLLEFSFREVACVYFVTMAMPACQISLLKLWVAGPQTVTRFI